MKLFSEKVCNKKENKNLLNKCFIAIIVFILFCTGCAAKGEVSSSNNNNSVAVATDLHADSNGGNEIDENESDNKITGASTPKPTIKPTVKPNNEQDINEYYNSEYLSEEKIDLSKITAYSGLPYAVVNDNKPFFKESEITSVAYEKYSSLDELGRCGATIACCGIEIMPSENEERESISHIKPTGWVQAQYDCISGKYLYNRCHLIGWQLSAENANPNNLITGTKYINVQGMLPFENMVADYINETNNHVMYRVTPIFDGNNLLASGVQMEAYSVEDAGEGICFNVYCYNVQPDVIIDYSTGKSEAKSQGEVSGDGEQANSDSSSEEKEDNASATYILNTNTKKIHIVGCSSVNQMSEKNKKTYVGDVQELINQGYSKCGNCW